MKSPYRPITQDLADGGLLVTIKQAAAEEGACESTLKANAKSRRLPAYQAHFGAPVMVLPSEVRDFLKSRPDITSRHHPKPAPAPSRAESPPAVATVPDPGFPFPDEGTGHPVVGRWDPVITVTALRGIPPATRSLVAACLSEIARQIAEADVAEDDT